MSMISNNIAEIKSMLPPQVRLEAAAKTRSSEEIDEAIKAGADIIGHNYVQEGERAARLTKDRIPLHFIGHMQTNKVKKAIEIFDMIETLDSLKLASEIEKRCAASGKTMDVLIEVNSGRESNKFGIMPENVIAFAAEISVFKHIRVCGLMTMGPFTDDPEEARPYFVETRRCFEKLGEKEYPNMIMRDLSMGMTGSYKTAIEEGANIVRVGTKIFGRRE